MRSRHMPGLFGVIEDQEMVHLRFFVQHLHQVAPIPQGSFGDIGQGAIKVILGLHVFKPDHLMVRPILQEIIQLLMRGLQL